MPASVPPCTCRPVRAVWKRTSPPRDSISPRMARMTPRSRSVPMWGFCRQAMSSGAPWSRKAPVTKAQSGSPMRVVSLPSEKVPAPPSPNWMLAFSSSSPAASNRCTACTRRSRSGPRSSTRGRYPDRASSKAANSPAGPSPTTTGRWASGACPRGKRNCGGCLKQTQGEAPASAGSSPSSLSVTAMVYTSTGLPCRASTESLATPQRAARTGGTRRMRRACAAASASGAGQVSGRRILRTKSIGKILGMVQRALTSHWTV